MASSGPFVENASAAVNTVCLVWQWDLCGDEPTSGLDSTTAQRIVSTLWEPANGGRTVVMTIHQPSSRLFYMFHKVLLLPEGSPIYFGEGARVMDYFSSLGFAPSVAMNPSDFLLDLANGIIEDGQCRAELKKNLVSAYKTYLVDRLKAELEETDFEQDNIIEEIRWMSNILEAGPRLGGTNLVSCSEEDLRKGSISHFLVSK